MKRIKLRKPAPPELRAELTHDEALNQDVSFGHIRLQWLRLTARRSAQRHMHGQLAEAQSHLNRLDAALSEVIGELIDGTLSEPLDLRMGDIFAHFGSHASGDALANALRTLVHVAHRPPAYVSEVRRTLESYRRRRGRPGGIQRGDDSVNPDSIEYRNYFWLEVSDTLERYKWTREEIVEYITGHENPDEIEFVTVRDILQKLRKRRKYYENKFKNQRSSEEW